MKKFTYYDRCSITTKIRYPTNTTANIDKNRMVKNRKTTIPLETRYCDDCRGFHIYNDREE